MAILPIRYRLAAVEELDAAVAWYSELSTQVANELRRMVRSKLAEARRYPGHWPRQPDGTRHIRIPPFPYLLVVRESAGNLELLAFAHTSREPGYWRERLE